MLNSGVLDFYLKHISTVYAGQFYSYDDQFIKHLPIKLPITPDERGHWREIGLLAERLGPVTDDLRAAERERDAFPAPQNRSLPTHHNLRPLRDLVSGTAQAQGFNRDQATFNQPTLDGRIAMRFGTSTLIVPHGALADVVRQWVALQAQETVAVSALLALRVPETEVGCDQIMGMLTVLKRHIDALMMQRDADMATLEGHVALYYGLGEIERQRITDFLRRFSVPSSASVSP